ncbi:hypothetical protein ZOSMA_2G02300 [Zostera marina]|uniref:3-hydroxyisobutyryl-CoA hydrolase n=1 Tax=Zostera marina TaxID=29655 RepID=A0A0K9PDD6_ZOSMR|nr:hypothetical protein ZOSMA_2G02300 [Zostera marina]
MWSCSVFKYGLKIKSKISLRRNIMAMTNELSNDQISELLVYFTTFEETPDVKLVILKGNGRAFSVGGDVSAGAIDCINGHWSIGTNYLWHQFTLNYMIATYSKPQVSILNGLVLGGGAGISIHGKFRVATENAIFAMPETKIGHIPDVGSTYFLSRLVGYFGIDFQIYHHSSLN